MYKHFDSPAVGGNIYSRIAKNQPVTERIQEGMKTCTLMLTACGLRLSGIRSDIKNNQ